jgi:hypothetical protein
MIIILPQSGLLISVAQCTLRPSCFIYIVEETNCDEQIRGLRSPLLNSDHGDGCAPHGIGERP